MPEEDNSCPAFTAPETPASAGPDALKLLVRPRMLPGKLMLLETLPLSLLLAVLFGVFCGLPVFAILQRTNVPVPLYSGVIGAGLFGMIGIPLIGYLLQKRKYARTEYRFYADRLEVREGILFVHAKTVYYRKVTEVSLNRGAIQKRAGLGTVVLFTLETSMACCSARGGIPLADIPDPQDVYARVKELVARAS